MRADYYLTQNDIPISPLVATLKDATGAVVNLGAATQIKFRMRSMRDDTLRIDASASIVNPPGTDGKVKYTFVSGDTSVAGDYWGEFEVQWSSGANIVSFPTHPKILIRIVKEVG